MSMTILKTEPITFTVKITIDSTNDFNSGELDDIRDYLDTALATLLGTDIDNDASKFIDSIFVEELFDLDIIEQNKLTKNN
jgi:hypothetical protein